MHNLVELVKVRLLNTSISLINTANNSSFLLRERIYKVEDGINAKFHNGQQKNFLGTRSPKLCSEFTFAIDRGWNISSLFNPGSTSHFWVRGVSTRQLCACKAYATYQLKSQSLAVSILRIFRCINFRWSQMKPNEAREKCWFYKFF